MLVVRVGEAAEPDSVGVQPQAPTNPRTTKNAIQVNSTRNSRFAAIFNLINVAWMRLVLRHANWRRGRDLSPSKVTRYLLIP